MQIWKSANISSLHENNVPKVYIITPFAFWDMHAHIFKKIVYKHTETIEH